LVGKFQGKLQFGAENIEGDIKNTHLRGVRYDGEDNGLECRPIVGSYEGGDVPAGSIKKAISLPS
jgi:hypothetical protein